MTPPGALPVPPDYCYAHGFVHRRECVPHATPPLTVEAAAFEAVHRAFYDLAGDVRGEAADGGEHAARVAAALRDAVVELVELVPYLTGRR